MEPLMIIPLAIGVISILIYMFGFKPAQQPKFSKLTTDSSSNKSNSIQKAKRKENTVSEKKKEHVKDSSQLKESQSKKKEEKKVEQFKSKKSPTEHKKEKSAETKKDKKSANKNEKLKQRTIIVQEDIPQTLVNDDDGWREVSSKKNKKNDDNNNSSNKVEKKTKPNNKKDKNKQNKKQEDKVEEVKSVNIVYEDISKVVNGESDPAPTILEVVTEAVALPIEKQSKSKKSKKSDKDSKKETEVISGENKVEEIKQVESTVGVVFDEIGETWSEPKTAKKSSKKKSRKD